MVSFTLDSNVAYQLVIRLSLLIDLIPCMVSLSLDSKVVKQSDNLK